MLAVSYLVLQACILFLRCFCPAVLKILRHRIFSIAVEIHYLRRFSENFLLENKVF